MASDTHIFRTSSGWGFGISWSAIIIGALVAIATSFALLSLGTGVGLSLYSASAASARVTFFTLSAAYFMAAQAMGFAFGGHVAGRLCGELSGTQREEDLRAGLHGLVVWALAIVAAVILASLSADNLTSAIHRGLAETDETARKAASFAMIWLAIAMIFGAIVAVAGAVYARIEEDRLPVSKRA